MSEPFVLHRRSVEDAARYALDHLDGLQPELHGPALIPHVEALIAEVERLRAVAEQASLWRDRVAGLILGTHERALVDAVDEWRSR